MTKGLEERPGVQARLEAVLAQDFDTIVTRVSPLEPFGPPVGWPLKFRIGGPDATEARACCAKLCTVLGENPNVRNINYATGTSPPRWCASRSIRTERARFGISSQSLASNINAILSGTVITQVRDDIYLVDVVARAVPEERAKLETLRSLMIATPDGRSVPLSQVATLSYQLEPPLIWSRQRQPTVTVQADLRPGVEAATAVRELEPKLAEFRAALPPGYSAVVGGSVEDSAKAQASIFAVFPLMLIMMITILMVQLQSFRKLILVLATAPLALIGVAASLLLFRAPMGFVAILGVISLAGMVIRNSVILIDQIDTQIAGGQDPWHAVITATEHRFRPIILTASAAILGMNSDCVDGVLGAYGVCGDGRAVGGDASDARLPAGALCGLVRN